MQREQGALGEARVELAHVRVQRAHRKVRRAAARDLAGETALELVVHRAHDRARIVDHEQRVGREVVEQRLQLEERGQVAVATEERAARRQVVDQRPRLGRRKIHRVAQIAQQIACARFGVVGDDHVARGRRDHARHGVLRALIVGIEELERRDQIAVHLDADRRCELPGPNVDQPAAQRVAARIFHDRDAQVAGGRELLGERDHVELLLDLQRDDGVLQRLARGHAPKQRAGRDYDRRSPGILQQFAERGGAQHGGASIPVHVGVGRSLARREHEGRAALVLRQMLERQVAAERRQVGGGLLRDFAVRDHVHDLARALRRERVGHERGARAFDAHERAEPALGERVTRGFCRGDDAAVFGKSRQEAAAVRARIHDQGCSS